MPSPSDIPDDMPMRLEDAVKIAFPMGGMTVSGLRRERDAGRLVVRRIAGKDFTTLADIRNMMEACRYEPRPSATHRNPANAALADQALKAQEALRLKLRANKDAATRRQAEQKAAQASALKTARAQKEGTRTVSKRSPTKSEPEKPKASPALDSLLATLKAQEDDLRGAPDKRELSKPRPKSK